MCRVSKCLKYCLLNPDKYISKKILEWNIKWKLIAKNYAVACCYTHTYLTSLDEGWCCIVSKIIIVLFCTSLCLITKFVFYLLLNKTCSAFYSNLFFILHKGNNFFNKEILKQKISIFSNMKKIKIFFDQFKEIFWVSIWVNYAHTYIFFFFRS